MNVCFGVYPGSGVKSIVLYIYNDKLLNAYVASMLKMYGIICLS